jgi:hypothetical protein
VGLALLAACKGEPDATPFCSLTPIEPAPPATPAPTYWRDVKPVLDSACVGCHHADHVLPLDTPEAAVSNSLLIAQHTGARIMPPWQGASCCRAYHNDFSLTGVEIATLAAWDRSDAPLGDPATEPPPLPARYGLSRVDLAVAMSEPYTPAPPEGSSDDVRCFVADWPLAERKFVTGLAPEPGNHAIVHHLIVGVVPAGEADELEALDDADPRPGFDCGGGFGGLRQVQALGGSLLGADYPDGLGRPVEPGSKIILNVHYSTARAAPTPDLTRVLFKLDDDAREFKGLAIANPAWLVDDAMRVEAGDPDAVFWYHYQPTLFTRGKKVWLRSVTPHMHEFGSKIVVRVIRAGGERVCLLEIASWDFGWEQGYWFAEPVELAPDDELYLECHFDNSAANQPAGRAPRDFAWGGNDQDMCAAFLNYTEAP